MSNGGYVKIWRKIKSHPFWIKKRKFSNFEAWIDLIMRANGIDREVEFRGEIIPIKRGSFIASERKLAESWGWSRDKVRSFLKICANLTMIRPHKSYQRYTIITLLNYDTYNPSTTKEPTTKQTSNPTTDPTILIKEKKGNEKIYYDDESKSFGNISEEDLRIWKEAYPACDVDFELKKMVAWIDANPEKRKKAWKRFINNWLSKVQDRGGTKKKNSIKTKRQLWQEEQYKKFLEKENGDDESK